MRSYAVTHPPGIVVLPQPAGWDQLVHTSNGVMTVQADDARWVVTPERAVWVPEGIRHRIELTSRVRLRTLYLRAGLAGLTGGVRAMHVDPLTRELVLHLVAAAPLWLVDERHDRLVRVLVDQLEHQAPVSLRLPWPVDERARALAELIVADPGSSRTIADLARATGGGLRTLERLFTTETALTPQRWRIRARLLHATRLLAEGRSVTAAAVASGYSTPSAFAAAFRQQLGTTPTGYLAGRA